MKRTPFSASLRQEAIGRESSRFAGVFPVELESGVGLLCQIGDLGNGALHTEAHFVLGDFGFQSLVARPLQLDFMKLLQAVEHVPPAPGGNALRAVQVEDCVFVGPKAVPACFPGRKPLSQSRETRGCPPLFLVTNVTKLGRFSFIDPNP